jgi:hypothetical protein
MDDFDTNVDNYTNEELLSVLGLDNTASSQVVSERCTEFAQKYDGNYALSQFFEQVKERLLTANAPTVFASELKRGNLNPDVKNTVTRMLNIDTYYRDHLELNNGNTDDCAFQLTEELRDVVSLTLYSVEIPQTWYNFTEAKGNTAFVFCFNFTESVPNPDYDPADPSLGPATFFQTSVNQHVVQIPDGNYNNVQLLAAVNANILAYYGLGYSFTQDPINGIVSLANLNQWTSYQDYLSTGFSITLRFFDPNYGVPEMRYSSINNNLGWALGFRSETAVAHKPVLTPAEYSAIPPVGGVTTVTTYVTAPCVMSTALTKYVMMRVDDFKQNRLNRGIVNIQQTKEAPNRVGAICGAENSYFDTRKSSTETAPTAPRRLTNNQLYGIKAVNEKRAAMATRTRSVEPNDADIFAKIPLRDALNTWSTYDAATQTNVLVQDGPARLIVEFSGPLQMNVREYFGPVNISALRVTLYDDHGNILGLNGHDWSCTILVKSLYQY